MSRLKSLSVFEGFEEQSGVPSPVGIQPTITEVCALCGKLTTSRFQDGIDPTVVAKCRPDAPLVILFQARHNEPSIFHRPLPHPLQAR
jgi:hypothetical protein